MGRGNDVKRWRTIVVCTAACIAGLVVEPLPSPHALAWSNGTDSCDSYGTHDWILDRALQAVREEADWVRMSVALRATDDPDCVDGIDHASGTWWHVYDRWGEEWGGADEAARAWFRRMKDRLEAGNERAASKALGYLAHVVGDVAQPMHTDSSEREDGVHGSYESSVDSRISDYTFTYDGRHPATAGPKTRAVAGRAHRYYWDLVRVYDNSGFNDKVQRITRRQLNRAANALADLITSSR